jgi:hypothetical protein
MNWCFYEAGQFRAKLDKEPEISDIRDRICCLYDVELPNQFSQYQATIVSGSTRSGAKLNVDDDDADSLDAEDTPLFGFFELIIERSYKQPLRDVADAQVRKLMRSGVRRITRAFLKNAGEDPIGERVFQPRISFKLPLGSSGLTADTIVNGFENSLATIFGIAENSARWEDIKRSTSSENNVEALWIGDLEAASQELAQARIPTQTDALCVSTDGGFYRPVIARYELYRSGAKNCYIAFIPTRNRQFKLGLRSSLLLSALILSVRFRQRILPIIEDLSGPSRPTIDVLLKFQKEVTSIETEAIEFGLPVPKNEFDDPPLLNAFRDGNTKDQLRTEILDWTKTRNLIFEKIAEARSPTKQTSPADAAKLIVDGLVGLRKTNGLFITALTQELVYLERVESASK